MGIQGTYRWLHLEDTKSDVLPGLLPLLKSIHKPTHLRNFSGKTIGIDAYGWLHRGTVACAIELAQDKPTRKHIDFAMNRVRMLIHFGVKPYLVFDGDYLPSKGHTEKDRAARRKESRRAGLQLLQAGKTAQAQQELQKAVDVTPLMAREMIEELKAAGIPYVVAPYEADSQLAYLEQQGTIQGVLSEDSDLLVFGVRCLLTKLDQYGECVMIRRDDFTACRELSLVGWKLSDFRIMAMLSGCDYLPGIQGMGLKTAYRLVRKHKTVDRLIRAVQFDGKMKVPADYLESFTKAEQTFLYQWVYCQEAKCLVNLTKLPNDLDVDNMPYIGKSVDPGVATGVAAGDLDPNTKLPIRLPKRPDYAARRSISMQTPSEKPSKPISEFFKTRRTPLAELDPNSFTPSPSQRLLLESQPGASWSASRLPAMRPPGVTRVASMPVPSSAPQPARRTMSAQIHSGRSPPKRQRLCSESILATSSNGVRVREDATSRFFAPSPSLRKASSKKDEFELWSDESAHDAVAALADTPAHSPSPKKRKRLSVFSDASPADMRRRDSSASQKLTQDTVSSFASSISRESQVADTPATSFGSVGDSPHIFSKGLNARFDGLKSRWAYNPESISTKPQLKPPVQDDVLSKSLSPKEEQQDSFLTAEKLAKSEAIVPASSPILHNSPEEEAEDGGETEQVLSDKDWLDLEQQPAAAADLKSQIEVQGSEDMLVPESPRSNSCDGEKRSSLDLGRFAFTG
jgi:exonuclease 1